MKGSALNLKGVALKMLTNIPMFSAPTKEINKIPRLRNEDSAPPNTALIRTGVLAEASLGNIVATKIPMVSVKTPSTTAGICQSPKAARGTGNNLATAPPKAVPDI